MAGPSGVDERDTMGVMRQDTQSRQCNERIHVFISKQEVWDRADRLFSKSNTTVK